LEIKSIIGHKKFITYTFELVDDSTVYHVQFIDTPSLGKGIMNGDDDGDNNNNHHLQNIFDNVSKTPELNAIVLMINGSDPLLITYLRCVISYIMEMIPDVCKNNLIVLLSNVNLKPKLDVKELVRHNIPAERIFYMNNEIFSIDIQNAEIPTLNEVNFSFVQLKIKLNKLLDVANNMNVFDISGFGEFKEKKCPSRFSTMQLQTYYDSFKEKPGEKNKRKQKQEQKQEEQKQEE